MNGRSGKNGECSEDIKLCIVYSGSGAGSSKVGKQAQEAVGLDLPDDRRCKLRKNNN